MNHHIDIKEEYSNALNNIVLFQKQGVTHFYGCELDLVGDRHVWLCPVEVDDGQNYSYFQLLYINTTPKEAINIPVSLLEIDEGGHKLISTCHPAYQQSLKQLNGTRQQVLIRRCNSGMAYYPKSVTPLQDLSVGEEHLRTLIDVMGWDEPEMDITVSKPAKKVVIPKINTKLFDIITAREYPFADGKVFSYGLILHNDPWKYYEIFTPNKLETIPTKDLLVRIDSGCDIGQIYDDRGCDCREQLHTALIEMQKLGTGIVIHIPAQDGRGYGAAIKMETEGFKRGIKVATNHDLTPMDTITAAQKLLGKCFDIRTYDGAGKILRGLGVESVILQTDNRLKAEGLEGIIVSRKPTNTNGTNGSKHHIEAKHKHSEIYYGC